MNTAASPQARPRTGAASAMSADMSAADRAAELDARTQRLAAELRCLVCQNQTVADSQAPLALDLKAHVRGLLAAGRSEDQVRADLVARYGDFVLYKPPVKASTAVLWAGPGLLLAGLLAGGVWALRRRAALPDQAFEAAFEAGSETSSEPGSEAGFENSPAQPQGGVRRP